MEIKVRNPVYGRDNEILVETAMTTDKLGFMYLRSFGYVTFKQE